MKWNFKLTGIHLFIILLGSLILFSTLRPIMEGFDKVNKEDQDSSDHNKPKMESSVPLGDDTTNNFLHSISEKTGKLIDNVYTGNKETSYIGPAGDTVIVDNPRQPMQLPQPMGIPKSQIPTGSEDLYILKSQVIPPVCPACPNVSACPRPAL